ncbi:MAG: hypothetical protein ACYC5Y_15270 [Symbiobacteriia bacterium]
MTIPGADAGAVNLADAAIILGVGLFFWLFWREPQLVGRAVVRS